MGKEEVIGDCEGGDWSCLHACNNEYLISQYSCNYCCVFLEWGDQN